MPTSAIACSPLARSGSPAPTRSTAICGFRPGWVDHLYIRPERHHLGLGTALLGQAMAVNTRLLLWTFQRNTSAIGFYRARGFRLLRETDGSRNEEHEPDALLEWTA